MRIYSATSFLVIILLLIFCSAKNGSAQNNFKNSELYEFQKQELNWGLHFKADNEREETRTESWREYEELQTGALKFQLNNRFLNFLDYKQERIEFNIEAGPLWGNGSWVDSSSVANIEADQNIAGLRANISASYSSRFYYNKKNYTLVQINGWARYDLYKQNSTGLSTDSDDVVSNFEEQTTQDKFRVKLNGRAGWGMGRLKPMNNYMIAEYLLKKYYGNTNFSREEKIKLANEINKIKRQRSLISKHNSDIETQQLQEYLNQKMFQIPGASMEEDWNAGEFSPRFDGNRVEFGPFFSYYNREPDFIYGGYVLYNHAKYCNQNWNRNFSAGLNYNAYKRQDWILGEISMSWSYFVKLKSQLDFGMKYIPGIAVNGSDDVGSLNNGFIPHIGYFTQINSNSRIDIKFAYRISQDEKLMFPGPELSVSVYRSRY